MPLDGPSRGRCAGACRQQGEAGLPRRFACRHRRLGAASTRLLRRVELPRKHGALPLSAMSRHELGPPPLSASASREFGNCGVLERLMASSSLRRHAPRGGGARRSIWRASRALNRRGVPAALPKPSSYRLTGALSSRSSASGLISKTVEAVKKARRPGRQFSTRATTVRSRSERTVPAVRS